MDRAVTPIAHEHRCAAPARHAGTGWVISEPAGRDTDGRATWPFSRPSRSPSRSGAGCEDRRHHGAGLRLCAARQRPAAPAEVVHEQPLEPLLPGFLCASPAP